MKPQLLLLPPDAGLSLLNQTGIIFRRYQFNGDEFYFSLYPEAYPEGNNLEFTGRYLVVLLSIRGTETFYILPGADDTYVVDKDEEDPNELNAFDADLAIAQIEGVHLPPPASDTDEDAEIFEGDFGFDREDKPFVEWITFDSQGTLLPLINEAIKEAS